jgi:hypothetical protein
MASVDLFLTEVLRPVLGSQDNGLVDNAGEPIGPVTMVTRLPPDSATYEHLAFVRHITGTELGHGRDFASITADCYAPDQLTADRIAELVRDTLRGAARRQTVYESGYISTYECTVVPFLFPRTDGVDEQERVTAQYRLLLKAST